MLKKKIPNRVQSYCIYRTGLNGERITTLVSYRTPDIAVIRNDMSGIEIEIYSPRAVHFSLNGESYYCPISFENLTHLLKTADIRNGRIVSECVWMSMRQGYWLITKSSKLYNDCIERDNFDQLKDIREKDLCVGGVYLNHKQEECIFAGNAFRLKVISTPKLKGYVNNCPVYEIGKVCWRKCQIWYDCAKMQYSLFSDRKVKMGSDVVKTLKDVPIDSLADIAHIDFKKISRENDFRFYLENKYVSSTPGALPACLQDVVTL